VRRLQQQQQWKKSMRFKMRSLECFSFLASKLDIVAVLILDWFDVTGNVPFQKAYSRTSPWMSCRQVHRRALCPEL
jgi:hypothetical protein